jgi:hypothetical protein
MGAFLWLIAVHRQDGWRGASFLPQFKIRSRIVLGMEWSSSEKYNPQVQ